MGNFITKSITRKLILTLFSISLVPIFVLYFVIGEITEELRSELIEQLEEQFDEKVVRLEGSLEQRIFEMDVLTHDILFYDLLLDLPNIQIQNIDYELKTKFLDYAKRTAYVDTILEMKIYDKQGIEKFSLYDTHLNSINSGNPISKINDITVKFGFDETIGRTVVAESPIIDPNNSEIIGLLYFVTDMRNFDPILLDRSGLRETGEAYFVNPDKLMMSESRFLEDVVFNQKVDTLGVNQCIENNTSVQGIQYLDYREELILGYSKCMLENDVVLLVEIDVQELTAPLDAFHNQINFIIIVVSFLTFVISLIIGRNMAKPIKELKKFAKEISMENFDASINFKPQDELGELADIMEDTALKLKEIQKQKDEFASMITHELKTPLVPIQGYCANLKNPKMGQLNELQTKAVDEIYNNSVELLQLIENILNAQKIELHQLKFNIKNISLDEYLEERYTALLPIMKEKNIQFKISTEKKLSVKADPAKLNEIITNLVLNSVDFAPEENGIIVIGAKEHEKQILFYVIDNGPGIPEDKIKNIFKKFYQIDTSLTRKHGGSGLGLSICKGYVEGMGGKIWVESKPNVETSFCFTLPKSN